MGTMKNLTGQRFGKLTAIKPIEERKHGNVQWLCKCDCGNEVIVKNGSLQSGSTKSCGCLRVENINKVRANNRKHFGCMYCGSDKHHAKGLCRNCYEKARRGTLD